MIGTHLQTSEVPSLAARWIREGAHDGDLDRVIALARRLEPSVPSLIEWLCTDPVPRLGGLTAIELVHGGQGGRVIDLLRDALGEEERSRAMSVGKTEGNRPSVEAK